MDPFQFKCRAINIEHSCRHGDEEEPQHPPKLRECIAGVVKATQGMLFHGIIKSPANSYQIDVRAFDSKWIETMEATGWKRKPLPNFKELNLPEIKPDALLTQDNVNVAIEIEKSNEKTVWFDFIKLLMLIGRDIAHFGLLVVPKNYAFRAGKWSLFNETRYYRWCLIRFAKVDPCLLSKIAIIGYTQEVYISGRWAELDKFAMRDIKEQARAHFS